MELIKDKKMKFQAVDMPALLGCNEEYLHLIENKFKSLITVRGDTINIKGSAAETGVISKIFKELVYLLRRNGQLSAQDVNTVVELLDDNYKDKNKKINPNEHTVVLMGDKDSIRVRNKSQANYYKTAKEKDLVFAIGPAGTGKTYLAVAMAVAALKRNEVTKIILARPAVEAGESLGFLPGDLKEKLDPYMRPLTDALFDMINPIKLKSMLEKNIIEITPLAYMRGRTLNNSFIILDEAQNATRTQMKMFLTRLGNNSRAIVTGDVTQIDLENKHDSGLISVQTVLKDISGIGFVHFSKYDVVRHKLVAEIISAYEDEAESENQSQSKDKSKK